jgi:hypothetical protein
VIQFQRFQAARKGSTPDCDLQLRIRLRKSQFFPRGTESRFLP